MPGRYQVCLTLHLNVLQQHAVASASLWECVSWLTVGQAVVDVPARKHDTHAHALLRLLLYQAYKADFGSEQLQAIHAVRAVLKIQAYT